MAVTRRRRGGAIGLLAVAYLVIGAFVAGSRNYLDDIGSLERIVSGLLALLLWPLVLIGVNFNVNL